MSILIVISLSTYEFVAVIIPIGFVYYFVQRFYVATSRQLQRLESASRSPIYSYFGESIQGASIIRAYNVQQRCVLTRTKFLNGFRPETQYLFFRSTLGLLRISIAEWMSIRNAICHPCMQLVGWPSTWNWLAI